MRLFREIQNVWMHDISASTLQAIQNTSADDVRLKHLDIKWYMDNISGLKYFLQSLNIDEIKEIWLMTTCGPKSDSWFHVDHSDRWKRAIGLNIPIENTHNTFMTWHDRVTFTHPIMDVVYGQVNYYTGGDEIGRLQLDQTCLVRTDCPHRVLNPNQTTRRVLSITPQHESDLINLWSDFEYSRYYHDPDSIPKNSVIEFF